MNNVRQVLESAYRGDQQATQQLLAYADSQLSNHLTDMVKVFTSSDASVPLRQTAGFQIKTAITGQSEDIKRQKAEKWLALPPAFRNNVKNALLQLLSASDSNLRKAAADVVSSIAVIELPAAQWEECVPGLARLAADKQNPLLRQTALTTLGYICSGVEPETLGTKTNALLHAIIVAMGPEEKVAEVKLAAVTALLNAVEFIEGSMKTPKERSIIMQAVVANLNLPQPEVRFVAMQVLVEIAELYYSTLPDFMTGLFKLTRNIMEQDQDKIAQQAIEFWSTIADTELDLILEEQDFGAPSEPIHHFIKGVVAHLLPTLLKLLLKQNDDIFDDSWNSAKAASTCLRLIAAVVGNDVVPVVMPFVTEKIKLNGWRDKEAALMAFGCILEGPTSEYLAQIVQHAMPKLIELLNDENEMVRDTDAWAIGTICEEHPELVKESAARLFGALTEHLTEEPSIAAQICYALHYLAAAFEEDGEKPTSPFSSFFRPLMQKLISATSRTDLDENNLRSAVYEAMYSIIRSAPQDCKADISNLVTVFIKQLHASFQVGDKRVAANMQASLCGVLLVIVSKLGQTIKPSADELMKGFLSVFAGNGGREKEEALLAIGAMANSLGQSFDRYMKPVSNAVLHALANLDDVHVCGVAISLVSDLAHALEARLFPYCDALMTRLLQNLRNQAFDRDSKPLILSAIGDIAMAINGNFERYLPPTLGILESASAIKVDPNDGGAMYYLSSLREAVLECYSSILQALAADGKQHLFQPTCSRIIGFVVFLAEDPKLSIEVRRNAIALIGDLAVAFKGKIGQELQRPKLMHFLNEAAQGARNDKKLNEIASWAIAQVKACA